MKCAVKCVVMVLLHVNSLRANPVTACDLLNQHLRLNQIQIKGTHNSYHVKPRIITPPEWDYSLPSLHEQLEHYGIRSFELDLHLSDESNEIEVYHIKFLDERSTCKRFVDCLTEIRDWSNDNRHHIPLFIWIEVKDITGGKKIRNLSHIEATIRTYLGDRLITPDDVKGSFASLREAIEQRGWPRLQDVRGKVMFVLLNTNNRHAQTYTRDYTSLDNRLMFAKAADDQLEKPWAVITHETATDVKKIRRVLANRFIVISTACLAGMQDDKCLRRRDAALTNGVHIIKDDYPVRPEHRDYWLTFPGDLDVRCNPVTAPSWHFPVAGKGIKRANPSVPILE
jgi:hypothetical protein